MSYQPNIPTGTVELDIDYQNLQNNFSQLDAQFGIDHIPFSNTSGTPPAGINGYHTSIHFNPQSTVATNPPNNNPPVVPATTPGFSQLFAVQINDGINPDEAMYYLTGGGRLTQMTRNFQPTIAANGATFLPGGLIMNWGKITVSLVGTPTAITFTQPFISGVYSITFGCINTDSPSPAANNIFVESSSVTNSGFNVINSSSGAVKQIYWTAIGS